MVYNGQFEITDALESTNMITKKFINKGVCLLAFPRKTLVINGVPYKNVIGFKIDPAKKVIEIARYDSLTKMTKEVKLIIQGDANYFVIDKNVNDVTIKY